MGRPQDEKKRQAARVYRETQNASETARRVGVNRVTVQRWLKEPGFLEADAEPIQGFPGLIPKALQVLDDALDGKKISPAQIRAALEVVKASNALKETVKTENVATLADLISELDQETLNVSD